MPGLLFTPGVPETGVWVTLFHILETKATTARAQSFAFIGCGPGVCLATPGGGSVVSFLGNGR